MSQDVQLVRLSPTARAVAPYRRSAFTVFAFALAVGALVHEWNSTFDPWVAIPVAVAALAVLVRPWSPVLLVLLLATLVAECVRQLPDPVNHQVLLGIMGTALGLWWLGLRVRRPEVARDPAQLYDRVAPFLRVGFILMWYLAAFAKMNAGFLDTASTCAVWIVESMPGVGVPSALVPVVIAGTLAMELGLPILLTFHRTRPLAIMVALPFHAISAVAGHSWFSGFAWAFYALFLPPAVLARGIAVARGLVGPRVRRAVDAAQREPWIALTGLVLLWLVTRYWLVPALGGLAGGARHWGAVLLCLAWMGFTAVVLWRLRRAWQPGAVRPRATLRVSSVVLVLGLVALVLNGATPYLGVKTKAAFTMFSNLRTEPGHWNPLLVPESARVFGWLDGGDVRFLATDEPAMQAVIDEEEADHVVLLGARTIATQFPDATVTYTLDGVTRTAEPVSSDPVLGRPLSFAEAWFGSTRSYAEGGTCQH